MVSIERVLGNKKAFLDLLLADEQEDMIDRYLPDGDVFALYDDGLKSVCTFMRNKIRSRYHQPGKQL